MRRERVSEDSYIFTSGLYAQVTASVIGPDDVLKVIDQGADDTTNAVSIRRFFAQVADVVGGGENLTLPLWRLLLRVPVKALQERQGFVFRQFSQQRLRLVRSVLAYHLAHERPAAPFAGVRLDQRIKRRVAQVRLGQQPLEVFLRGQAVVGSQPAGGAHRAGVTLWRATSPAPMRTA